MSNPTHADPSTLRLAPNVRTHMPSEKDQAEFEESVAMHGVISPLIVRWADGGAVIEVIAGQRRLNAAIKAGLPSVPLYFAPVDTDVDNTTVMQLIENIHRADMSLQDTADGVWEVYNTYGGSVASVTADMLGKSRSWVSKMLLVGAPDERNSVAKSLMAADRLSDIEMAYTLCRIEALSEVDAKGLAKDIETQTRASLQAALKQLQVSTDENPEEAVEPEPEPEPELELEPEPEQPAIDFLNYFDVGDLETLRFVAKMIRDGAVPPNELSKKLAAAVLIDRIVAEVERDLQP